MNIRDMACCGLREINGLEFKDSAKEAMTDFIAAALPKQRTYDWEKKKYETIAELTFSHVIFSEAKDGAGDYGERFAAYIKRNKLGDLAASERRINPNSGNRLKVWVWTLNKRGLVRWATENTKDIGVRYRIING